MLLIYHLFIVLLCYTCQIRGGDSNSGYKLKLCGTDFHKMYEYCCKQGCVSGKRQIDISEGYQENGRSDFDLILKRKAMSFLNYRRRNFGRDPLRSKRGFATDNAYEECCVEGCTIEEVREYPCY